jgi:hypothetical protein
MIVPMAAEDDTDAKPLCFAIMPITTPPEVLARYGDDPSHFIRVARHIFKPAVEAAGFEFRAPASTSSEIIQAEIIENLEKAELVLCDISQWNANVFFELGIRVALDRPVAMIKDSLTEKIPFDTAMLNCYTYDSSLDISRVEDQIPKLTTHINSAKHQTQNALWKFFGITQRAERPTPDDPVGAKLDLLLGEVTTIRNNLTMNRPQHTGRPDNFQLSQEFARQLGKILHSDWIPKKEKQQIVEEIVDVVYPVEQAYSQTAITGIDPREKLRSRLLYQSWQEDGAGNEQYHSGDL